MHHVHFAVTMRTFTSHHMLIWCNNDLHIYFEVMNKAKFILVTMASIVLAQRMNSVFYSTVVNTSE